jgi:HEAT repeat protein/Uri superfamily endonuclease
MESSIMGTYVLALWLAAPLTIRVGRLGEFRFPAGWYLYTGSALGPGGLQARLARHLRHVGRDKRAHWHIDYLREQATWGGAWGCATGERKECHWAAALRDLPGARIEVPGFGASDCGCPAHLVRLPALPGEAWLARHLDAEQIMLGEVELDELLDILTSGDDERREAAALALGRFGAQAVEPLVALLSTGHAEARWWAARTLAEVGGESAVAALVSVLADPDPDLRACAALALGHTGEASAAWPLARQLDDDSAFVASIAADALSLIGEPAVDALAGKLAADSPHTRLLAVRALARIQSERAIGPLFELLEDPSYLVRHYAHEALEALGVGLVFVAP